MRCFRVLSLKSSLFAAWIALKLLTLSPAQSVVFLDRIQGEVVEMRESGLGTAESHMQL